MAELLERDELLDRLATLPPGGFVFVGGEAGVGKTSLVRAVVERVGGRALFGSSENLTTPTPLGPFLDIGVTPGETRTVATAVLEELRRPTLLVLEDLHWADQATLDVLRVLCRRVDRTPSRVLATYRDDEVDGSHPLRVLLGELASAPAVSRVAVPRLSRDAVRELASGRTADADAVYELTRGNAFYVTEVLATGGGGALPETVRDAVLARAASLSAQARELIDVAALVPARAELWLLEAVAPAELEGLDECLSSGMLRSAGDAVEFRHELARLAIEDAIPPQRRRARHRAVLDALAAASRETHDAARLAHHAEGARDAEAVLLHAREAAAQAEQAWSHREAFAQYERILRYSNLLDAPDHAAALVGYARHAAVLGRAREAVDARLEAIRIYEALGDDVAVGTNMSDLANAGYIGLGENEAAERASRDAIAILERAAAPRALASAYATQAYLRMLSRDNAEGVAWGEKALALADRLDDAELRSVALNLIGTSHVMAGAIEDGLRYLEQSIEVAERHGLVDRVRGGMTMLASGLGEMYELARAEEYAVAFIAYASQSGADDSYIAAWLACLHAYRGRWDEATTAATEVLPRGTTIARITALIALGRVRARRGDPGVWEVLDEALELALPGGHLQRLGHVHAARAEAAALGGDLVRARAEAAAVFPLAVAKRHLWFAGELAYWQWKAGARDETPDWVAEPYALQLAGRARAAAEAWRTHDCPYEAARALAEADDDEAILTALSEFERLGAAPAAKLARESLRERGASVPRGPRAATRANPGELTSRELEVLRLVAAGLRNADVAAELVVSRRTVDHHVSAIFRKLGVKTRGEATATATRLGLLQDR